ncbi:hypothetical protein PCASD_08535 [Puccinia coronata f. sp. avenae]|uniref:CCHC-type domain-containing protein n=1 Tax=Puccinia coronata f. sp. avenae TaxID=200324 RepID=A0A2N5UR65_9BASI|nr:hypothetical protein PCASD_08535 [Puccinia coronata f. sp. avenae]
MKCTPPPPKKVVPVGTQGPPTAGSMGTASTGTSSGTSATSTTSSTTSTQWPSSSLGFNNDNPGNISNLFLLLISILLIPPLLTMPLTPANGSNFCSWLNEITEFAIMSLDDLTFYDHPQPADAKETVVQLALLILVHWAARQYLHGAGTSLELMSVLKWRYMVFSRVAQLNLWVDYVNTVCNKSTLAAGVANTMQNKLMDLREAGVDLSKVAISGIVLQTGVELGTDLWPESQPAMAQQDSVESHANNVYVMASRPGLPSPCLETLANQGCFRCGSFNHYISQCLAPQGSSSFHPGVSHPSIPLSAPPTARDSSNFGVPFQPRPIPHNARHAFHAHYPVLTLAYALYLVSYAPPWVAPAPSGLRPADSYHPNYRQSSSTSAPSTVCTRGGNGRHQY